MIHLNNKANSQLLHVDAYMCLQRYIRSCLSQCQKIKVDIVQYDELHAMPEDKGEDEITTRHKFIAGFYYFLFIVHVYIHSNYKQKG